MAFAEVSSGAQQAETEVSGVDSTPIVFPGNVTAGNLLLVVGSVWQDPGASSVSVTDTRSTSYTVKLATALANSGGNTIGFIAWGIAPSSGACTITIDPNSTGNYITAGIDEFSCSGAVVLDQEEFGASGSGTAISHTVTTQTANALVVAVAYTANVGGTLSLDAHIEIYTAETGANQQGGGAARVAGAIGNYALSWTVSTSQSWRAHILSLKEGLTPTGGAGTFAGADPGRVAGLLLAGAGDGELPATPGRVRPKHAIPGA